MKKLLFLTAVTLFVTASSFAQAATATPTPAAPVVKEANPADVGSLDAIMKGVFVVISVDAG